MKASYKRIVILMLASAVMALFSTGCGTVRGIGRDVESVGDHITNSAR